MSREDNNQSFQSFCQDREPVSVNGARLFGVSLEVFLDWRWQLKNQIHKLSDFPEEFFLSEKEREAFSELESIFKVGISPYYLSLIHMQSDPSLRMQAIPSMEEKNYRWGSLDPLEEQQQAPVDRVIHIYPDRVAFLVGGICSLYCRFCFRKRLEPIEGLHFNKEHIAEGLSYIKKNKAIKDVLITGGDPFLASDAAIEELLSELRKIEHVEIIRFGTRAPVTLPYRFTDDLCNMLAKYHPIWINTHFNCASEISKEAALACDKLSKSGIPLGNQSVLLKGVNDSTEKLLALSRGLLKIRVRPYYIFHPHTISGNAHFHLSLERGRKLMKSLRGNITGLGIPTYILDTPSGKIPIGYDHILKEDGNDILLENLRGEIWREKSINVELDEC